MKCNKDQELACRYCLETACRGLAGYKCIECMQLHLRCAYCTGIDYRPYIQRLKDLWFRFCNICEDRLEYDKVHICASDHLTMDWLDFMKEICRKDRSGGSK